MSSSRDVAAAGLVAAGLMGIAAYAALSPESQLFGRTVIAPPKADEVALTFDDGPNPVATPYLLEVLARHNVRATFFLIGGYVLREPRLVREIAAAGHTIGNHSMTHRRLLLIPSSAIREELGGCNAALEDVTGRAVRLFRPPYGSRTPSVLRAAAELGLRTVQWNVIVGDWKAVSAEVLLARLERKVTQHRRDGRGSNVVLHDGGQQGLGQDRMQTVRAVDLLLPRLLERGTRFVIPDFERAAAAISR